MTEPHKNFEQQMASGLRTVTACVVILAVFLGLSLAAATWAVVTGTNAINHTNAVAQREAAVARRADRFAADLVAQRDQTILRECHQQDARHKATVTELNLELAQVARHATKAQRKQLRASRAFTLLLIARLAPYENCQQQLAIDTATK